MIGMTAMSNNETIGVKTSDMVSNEIRALHDTSGLSFRDISALNDFCDIPPGTLWYIYCGGRVPNKYRKQLGMPLLVKVPETMVRKTAPQPPRNLERATIYRGTPPADVVHKLAALGHKIHYVEREIDW